MLVQGIGGAWRNQRALPPHPGPLPWGEGETFAGGLNSLARSASSQRFPREEPKRGDSKTTRQITNKHGRLFPLPRGEGQGEGEATVHAKKMWVMKRAKARGPGARRLRRFIERRS